MGKSNLQLALEIALQTKNLDDIDRLIDELKSAGQNVDGLQEASKRLSKAWDELNPNERGQRLRRLKEACVKVAKGQQVLADSLTKTGTAANKTDKQLEQLSDEALRLQQIAKAKVTLGIDKDEKARKQLIETTKAYELLKKSGTLTSKELARANQLHTEKVKKLEEELGKTVPTLSDMTAELGKVTAAAGGLAYVAKTAMSFEQAMAGVKKTTDGTPEQIQALSNEIKQLSVELGLASEDVAAIAAQGGQLGVPIEQLSKFAEMAGKMAVAFDMTAEEAADAAAKLANVFDIPLENVEALGDAINTLGNNTAAKEKEIVAAMLRIGGSAKQFGLAEEQAASLAAAMIALGKPPEVAATAINALLTKLQTAQGQGEKFQAALAGIGLSADQLAQDINANPQQALTDFLQTLGKLDKQQRSMATMQLFGQEYSDDISLLVGSLETYNKTLDLTRDKSANAGAMQKEFEAQMTTANAEIKQAKAALDALASTLGTHLLPIISATASGVTDVTLAINSFAESYPMITKVVVLLAGGKVALTALNSILKLTGGIGLKAGADIAKGFLQGKTAIDATTASAGKLNTQSNKLSGSLANLTAKAMALAAAFEAGRAGGNWLYENSSAVRTFGDELGRVLAYTDAIFTDRTFEDVDKYFETSAETAERLANAQKTAAQTAQEQAQAQQQAAKAAQQQADANRHLANEIIITQANVEQMITALGDMETKGQKSSQAYKDLSEKLAATQKNLTDMRQQAEAAGIGDMLKTDLEKAAAAFEALGLDAEEFATGLNSKTTQALTAFVEVASLAEGDVNKLARAYNAAVDAAGNNQQAQDLLNIKLNQVTEGNQELATAVKATADAQRNAKLASDEQAQALDKLGIKMDAVNNKMSASGLEMVNTLKNGITAIKAQATSADALKTALTQALDVSLAAAKTKADFAAIRQTLEETGVAGELSYQQLTLLQAGMAGGAEAAKDAAKAIDNNTTAVTKNTQAKHQQAKAANEVADAETKAAKATEKSAKSLEGMTSLVYANAKARLDSLQQLGATTEQTDAIMQRFADSMRNLPFPDYYQYAQQLSDYTQQTQAQADAFVAARTAAQEMRQSLGNANLTTQDLSHAQQVLNQATHASIQGIVQMDNQTLDNLKNAIDGARKRMQGLADDAKNTADNLQANLARLKGDDSTARQIEQTKKLSELNDKLTQAKKRGNDAEIAQLNRALELQKQIFAEETKQAEQRQREQQARENQQRTATQQPTRQANYVPINNTNAISAADVANAFDARIRDMLKNEGAQILAQQLMDEMKRRAR